MTSVVSTTARLLRAFPLPERVHTALWRAVTRGRTGEPYLFPVRVGSTAGFYGGVCGVSDHALTTDLTTYEAESIRAVTRVIGEGARPVILDVGAHTGAWVFLLKALRPDAVIHAFEPFPALASFLATLREANGWQDVHVERVLVGGEVGEGDLHFAPGGADAASTVADFQPSYRDSIRVPRLSLDAYAERAGLTQVALVKIDVEGGELEVLQGARRLLSSCRPPLLLELLHTTRPAHLERQRRVVELLQAAGYALFHIGANGELAQQDVVRPDPTYRALNYLALAR